MIYDSVIYIWYIVAWAYLFIIVLLTFDGLLLEPFIYNHNATQPVSVFGQRFDVSLCRLFHVNSIQLYMYQH